MGRIASWSAPITADEEREFRTLNKLGPNTQIYKVGPGGAPLGLADPGEIRVVFCDTDAEAYCKEHLGTNWRKRWPFVCFNGEEAVNEGKSFVAWVQMEDYARKKGIYHLVPSDTPGVERVEIENGDELLDEFRAKHGLPPRRSLK